MKNRSVMTTIATALALSASPVAAQLTNVPVYANPSVGTLMLAGDYSTGMNDESGKNDAFAARVTLAAGPMVFGAGIASVNYDILGKEPTYMASVGFRPVRGMFSLLIQAGAGVQIFGNENIVEDVKSADIPISMGFGLNLGIVQPWVAPRYTIQMISAGPDSENRNHFGASIGVDVNLIVGLGIQAALDWSSLPAVGDPSSFVSDLERKPVLVSLGAHWGF